ncbi:hypothetical protein ACWD25_20650 [Streptomyces sp. NPDC002920]
MNYRPYPDADRALHQVERHHPRVVVTLHADIRAFEDALRKVAERMPASGAFAANADALSRAFAKMGADAESARRAEALGQSAPEHPRRAGRNAITAAIVAQAVKAGQHVHIADRDGVRCVGGDGQCTVRRGPAPGLYFVDETKAAPSAALADRQPIVLARVVRTCVAIPSQWNAWTVNGQYLYLRFRSGIGTVDAYDTEDSEQWTRIPDGAVARFDTGDRTDGEMDLIDFCERTGLQLADDARVTGEPDGPAR